MYFKLSKVKVLNTRRVELVCAKELIFRYVAKPQLRKRVFLAKFVLENAAVLESMLQLTVICF